MRALYLGLNFRLRWHGLAMIDQFNYMNAMATGERNFFVCTLVFGTHFYLFLSIGRCFLLLNLFLFFHTYSHLKQKTEGFTNKRH